MSDSVTNATISTVSVSDDSAQEETSGLKELLENLKLSSALFAAHLAYSVVLIIHRYSQWKGYLEA